MKPDHDEQNWARDKKFNAMAKDRAEPDDDRLAHLEAENAALRDDICMAANQQPLDPDEDHDKNLLALIAQRDALRADLARAKAVLDSAKREADAGFSTVVLNEDGTESDRMWIVMSRAAWQAWREGGK